MALTIIILIVTVAMFVIGRMRADIVALGSLVVILHHIPTHDVYQQHRNGRAYGSDSHERISRTWH